MTEVCAVPPFRMMLTTSDLAAALVQAGQEPCEAVSKMCLVQSAAEASAKLDRPDERFPDRVLQALTTSPFGRAQLFSVNQVEHIMMFSDGVCLSWIAGAPELALAAPFTPEQGAAVVLEFLAPTEAAPTPPLTFEIPTGALMSFAACIDYLRFAYTASLVQRSPVHSLALSREDLLQQLSEGALYEDNRWLCALVGQFLPATSRSAGNTLDDGLARLCEIGLLKAVEGPEELFLPDPSLVNLALNLVTPLPAALLETRSRHRLILAGRSLWRLEIQDATATLSGIDGLDAIGIVQGAFSSQRSEETGHTVEKPETKKQLCAACGEAKETPQQKFCTNCGASFASE